MSAIFWLIDFVLGLFSLVILIRIIFSWLVSFEVLPTSNPVVRALLDAFYRLTEPALEKVRRVVPMFAGFDFSPLILIVAIQFARILIADTIRPIFGL